MKIVTSTQMRSLDENAANLGITGIQLMENAASAVVGELPAYASKFVICCGSGNNGGDGLAIARMLFLSGKTVHVIIANRPKADDAKHNFEILKNLGVPISTELDELSLKKLEECDVIVDALAGIGLCAGARGLTKTIIEAINNAHKTVVSVDVPSGINSDNGNVCGVAVKADVTVTFELPKIGLLTGDGVDYVGKLVIKPISLPINVESCNINMTDLDYINRDIQPRKRNSYKGNFGKILVVAGSTGLTGAAYLASEGALRSGSGLVTLAVPKSLNNTMEKKLTEVMTLPLPDKDGIIAEDVFDSMKSVATRAGAIVYGCGLTECEAVRKTLKSLILSVTCPIVIDADGLNVIAQNLDILKLICSPIVLTPHPMELARLCGVSVDKVNANRVDYATKFAQEHNVIVVLKGAGTIIASPEGECFINPTGNAGMATGGTGDILSGIIASLIGQGLSPYNAAITGAYIHGMCGDYAALDLGMRGMTANDILQYLPRAMKLIKE